MNVATWSDSGVWGVTASWFAFDDDFCKDQGGTTTYSVSFVIVKTAMALGYVLGGVP
jgi:hypothetical protein